MAASTAIMMDNQNIKLQREQRNIEILKETVEKSRKLTTGMCTILSSFDDRLQKLEQTILPVYKETGNLQRRQENITNTLSELDYVIQFYNVSKKVGSTVRKNPDAQNIHEYLECMEEIKRAIEYFDANNNHNSEAAILQSLVSTGAQNLKDYFETTLNKYTKPLTPVTILDMIEVDDELQSLNSDKSIDHLPKNIIEDLALTAKWLFTNKYYDYLEIYGVVRSRNLLKSLQGLKEHLKSCSGKSTNLVSSSPLLGGRKNLGRDTPPKRFGKKIQEALRKPNLRRTTEAAKSLLFSPHAAFRTTTTAPSIIEDKTEAAEVEGYLTCITALLKMMQSEAQLMRGIVPPEKEKAVLEHVVLSSLNAMMLDGEAMVTRVKQSVAKHNYLTVLCLFPVLQQLNSLRPEYDVLFDGCQQTVSSKLPGLETTLYTTLNKALQEFVDMVKNDPDTKMPRDGTVHELTSNVMMLLEHLFNFIDMVGAVLVAPDTAALRTSRDPNRCTLAQYVHRVLGVLALSLQKKSEAYTDIYLRAIFRLNNLHYVLQSLRKSGLLEVVEQYYPTLGAQYEENIRDQKRVYSQSWSKVLHYVTEIDKSIGQHLTSPTATSPKMRDKDRQAIKDRFAGFNKEIEEIAQVQKGYAIPDTELRETMKRDNKEFIVPKYRVFYEKNSLLPFARNKEKYIKYSQIDVSNMLDQFFDAAA